MPLRLASRCKDLPWETPARTLRQSANPASRPPDSVSASCRRASRGDREALQTLTTAGKRRPPSSRPGCIRRLVRFGRRTALPRASCVLRASGEQIIADGAWSGARFGCVLGLCRLPEDGGDAVYHSRSILIIQLQHYLFGRKPFQARRLGASALARRRQERGGGQAVD